MLKKIVTLALAILFAAVSFGCMPSGEVPQSAPSYFEAPSDTVLPPAPQDIPAPSIISLPGPGSAPGWPSAPDAEAFMDFYNGTGFGIFIHFAVNSPEDLKSDDVIWEMCGWLTRTMQCYNETYNIEPKRGADGYALYPLGQMEQLSREMLGFTYDFSNERLEGRYPVANEEGYVLELGGFGPVHSSKPLEGSLAVNGNNIIMTAEFYWVQPGETKLIGTRKLTFLYLPEQIYCPYQLVSSVDI